MCPGGRGAADARDALLGPSRTLPQPENPHTGRIVTEQPSSDEQYPACQKLGFPSPRSLNRNYDSPWIRWLFGKFMGPSNLRGGRFARLSRKPDQACLKRGVYVACRCCLHFWPEVIAAQKKELGILEHHWPKRNRRSCSIRRLDVRIHFRGGDVILTVGG